MIYCKNPCVLCTIWKWPIILLLCQNVKNTMATNKGVTKAIVRFTEMIQIRPFLLSLSIYVPINEYSEVKNLY